MHGLMCFTMTDNLDQYIGRAQAFTGGEFRFKALKLPSSWNFKLQHSEAIDRFTCFMVVLY